MKHVVLLTGLALFGAATTGFAEDKKAAPASENWENNCAKCHGPDGKGSTKIGKKLGVKDYTDATVQAAMKDDEMAKAITEGVKENGKERMKSFKEDLSPAEITDLVAYIRHMKS